MKTPRPDTHPILKLTYDETISKSIRALLRWAHHIEVTPDREDRKTALRELASSILDVIGVLDVIGDNAATGTERQVCEDIAERQKLGITKYGTTVADNPLSLRNWLENAYQEGLDKVIYLKRAIAEIDAKEAVKPPGVFPLYPPYDAGEE